MIPRKIIIFGLRGSGKTTLAKMVGEYFGLPRADLDELITTTSGESIAHIVESHGWEEFRKREHDMLASFLNTWTGGILSLGGGCPAFENNRVLLRTSGAKLIYIDVSPEQQLTHVLTDRENHSVRPPFNAPLRRVRRSLDEGVRGRDIQKSLGALDTVEDYQRIREERIGAYLKLADCIIENTGTLQEASEQIITEVQKGDICVSLLAEQSEQEHREIFSHPQVKCVEWRTDSLANCPADFLKTPQQRIITLRTKEEGGLWSGSDEEYFTELDTYIQYHPDFLDVEYLRWKNNPEKIAQITVPILLSYHNPRELPSNTVLTEILLGMMECRPSVVKIACKLQTLEDKNRLCETRTWFREKFPQQETVFIGMGELGSDLRGIFARDGDIYTFASVGASSAPGQMSVPQTQYMLSGLMPYRLACESWEHDTRINLSNSTTKLERKHHKSIFLGANQIGGSLSPEIHNSWAQSEKLDLEYLLCDLEKGVWGGMTPEVVLEIFETLPEVVGGNITMPYKVKAYEYFKQQNRLDEVGLLAGSVNTYFRGMDNKFYATSSDVDGFIDPIKSAKLEIADLPVVVLGAGGAARAIIAGVSLSGGSKVTIINRSRENYHELQKHFEGKVLCQFISLDDEETIIHVLSEEKHILVNTLPFGFKKELPSFPLKREILEKVYDQCVLYFDIVYDRDEDMTPSSAWFRDHAPHTHLIHGRDMLLAQAKKGYQLWKRSILG